MYREQPFFSLNLFLCATNVDSFRGRFDLGGRAGSRKRESRTQNKVETNASALIISRKAKR